MMAEARTQATKAFREEREDVSPVRGARRA
jgi:hypothetical protein